jgi:hypothetical protein
VTPLVDLAVGDGKPLSTVCRGDEGWLGKEFRAVDGTDNGGSRAVG